MRRFGKARGETIFASYDGKLSRRFVADEKVLD
jgi:hypothetical protein